MGVESGFGNGAAMAAWIGGVGGVKTRSGVFAQDAALNSLSVKSTSIYLPSTSAPPVEIALWSSLRSSALSSMS